MIKIEKTDVYGFETAVRAMRNSWDSWEKSDSEYETFGNYELGKFDKALMQKLVKAGDDHAKFMRFITVTCDITAPRYWLTQMDTYKVGTVRCSCSTMHTIMNKAFDIMDFSCDAPDENYRMNDMVKELNEIRTEYLYYKNADESEMAAASWRELIQLLPQSYNQRSTFMFNYQVLRHIYKVRKCHKLREWYEFCEWIEDLQYAKELIIE